MSRWNYMKNVVPKWDIYQLRLDKQYLWQVRLKFIHKLFNDLLINNHINYNKIFLKKIIIRIIILKKSFLMENKLFLFILFFFNNIFKGELPD